jgi:hypothetical protein
VTEEADLNRRLDRPTLRASVDLLGGLTAWGAQFTLVYGAVAVACGRGLGASRVLGVPGDLAAVLLATVLALGVTLALMLREALRLLEARHEWPSARFADATALALNALALVAILFTAAPALVLPGCR